MVIDFFDKSFDNETKKCIEDFICNLYKVNSGFAKQILRDIRYKNSLHDNKNHNCRFFSEDFEPAALLLKYLNAGKWSMRAVSPHAS